MRESGSAGSFLFFPAYMLGRYVPLPLPIHPPTHPHGFFFFLSQEYHSQPWIVACLLYSACSCGKTDREICSKVVGRSRMEGGSGTSGLEV
ncbi:hypothetical protein HOY82DRAFT_2856 [Tuber indicum]|nr:hypothetical protein HOY82DRAFT_2856 [Tuber indicum]